MADKMFDNQEHGYYTLKKFVILGEMEISNRF